MSPPRFESVHTVHAVPSAARCRIAILGVGTVGSSVARRLTHADAVRELELTQVFDRRADQKRLAHPDVAGVSWTSRIDDVLRGDADVVVETVGGLDPAADWIRDALLAGKSVVTANKQVMARDGERLLRLAARQGRQLRFEAAIGGAMPIVRAVADGLAGDRLTRIVAILNGTTNAVLSRMDATGCSLEDAIRDAQSRGYAERDPRLDLDGDDARAKLAILCAVAFGLRVTPADIAVRSSASVSVADMDAARRRGATIRQLACASCDADRSTLTAWVAPTLVSRHSLFGRAAGPQNAAIVTGAHAGQVGVFGAGAGGDATAVAVISDLVAIARDRAAVVPPPVLTRPRAILGFDSSSDFTLQTSDFFLAEAV
ncbi:MAG: homoserine dehydrogenase [Acidobacteria bacterium]|nr:homoserine dehydrogenase [Acidobacteriota bacterium]